MSEKSKKILAFLYVVGLVAGFLFVRDSLNTKQIDVIVKEEKEAKPKASKVNVKLDVKNTNSSREYEYELTDTESIYDLLQLSRANKHIYFETTEYSDKFEFTYFDEITSNTYGMTIFLNGDNVTQKINELNLVDGQTYTLRLTSNR